MKKMLIFVVILIFIAFIVGLFVYKNHDNGVIEQDDLINGKMYSHIYCEIIVNDETDLEKTITIYTFDEEDNCISVRNQFQFSNVETAQEQYKKWKNADLNPITKEDDEKIITFNQSIISNDISKKSVIEDYQKYSKNSPENTYTWYVF